MPILDELESHIRTTAGRELLEKMVRYGNLNYVYGAVFNQWFKNGGTLILRDILAEKFKKDYHKENDWFNAWSDIDSAHAKMGG